MKINLLQSAYPRVHYQAISTADTACGSLALGMSVPAGALAWEWWVVAKVAPQVAQKGKPGFYTGLLQGCKVCHRAAKGQEHKTNDD